MDSMQARKRAEVTTAVVLPLSAIVGIAIAGAITLFATLAVIAVVCARKRNHKKRVKASRKALEIEKGGIVDANSKKAARIRRPDATHSFTNRLSFNPFLPPEDERNWSEWMGDDGLATPTRRKSRRISPQKGAFRISAVRDSWPLVSNIPLALMPDRTASNIHVNNVAAPGYEIFSEPKWPKRTTSRHLRTSISIPRDMPRKRSQLGSYSPSRTPTRNQPRRGPHIRSASENQLSTILRSTSQRLKQANRIPLSRTLTNLSRNPGDPPLQPLPTIPRGTESESREDLIDSDHEESVASSVYELLRTPSPPKTESPRRSSQVRLSKRISLSPSAASDDSLCISPTPDLVIPGTLTSPSKVGSGQKRQTLRVSSSEGRNLSRLTHKSNRSSTSILVLDNHLKRSQSLADKNHFPSLGDPFSEVRSSMPKATVNPILEPRPLSYRKTTFGTDNPSQRPHSYNLPLQPLSGNVQNSSKKIEPSTREVAAHPNPFQWSAQTMGTRSGNTSPTRRKGHSRSKFVRVSQISHRSSVPIVQEESADYTWTQRLQPSYPKINSDDLAGPLKSVSPKPQSQPRYSRPPSAATFNPSMIDELTRSGDNSPTIGIREILTINSNGYTSPTLAGNYYTQSPLNSEEDFFAGLSRNPATPSRSPSRETRKRSRANSAELFPSSPQTARIVSFTASGVSLSPQLLSIRSDDENRTAPSSPRPSPRPLPPISTIYSSPSVYSSTGTKNSGLSSPLSPQLTMPIPGHLTGPRAEPTKRQSMESNDSTATTVVTPLLDSQRNSLGQLRRMDNRILPLDAIVSIRAGERSSPLSPSARIATQPRRVSSNGEISEGDSLDENRGRSREAHYLPSPTGTSTPIESSKSGASFLLPLSVNSQTRSQLPRPRRGTLSQQQPSPNEKRSSVQNPSKILHQKGNRGSMNVDDFLRGRGLVGGSALPDSNGKDARRGKAKAKVFSLTPVKEIWTPERVMTSNSTPESSESLKLPGMGLLNFGTQINLQDRMGPSRASSPNTNFSLPSPPSLPSLNSSFHGKRNSKTKRRVSNDQTSNMTSMMAVGELDDFFALETKVVDHSTFSVGSGSESEDDEEETNEHNPDGRTMIQKLSSLPSPLSPVLQNKPPSQYRHSRTLSQATQRSSVISREENDLLDLYRRSPCPPPPPAIHPLRQAPPTINPHTPTPARWSDATPKPPLSSTAIRRESQLAHPHPKNKSPPSWVLSSAGLGLSFEEQNAENSGSKKVGTEGNLFRLAAENQKKKALEQEFQDAKWTLNVVTPKVESAGQDRERRAMTPTRNSLYDEDGFYNSPDRKKGEDDGGHLKLNEGGKKEIGGAR